MSNTSYFIPTNSAIIPIYFGSGIIMPSGYYKGFQNSFQSLSESAIIISNDKWLPGSNCSLEVILSPDEIQNLAPVNESGILFKLDSGLPISRIKNLFFLDETQMENTVWNTDNGTAFIPSRIVSSEKASGKPLDYEVSSIEIESPPLADELTRKAKQFDILLGAFAFMKIAADKEINFPHNYFSTLGFFNSLIAEQVKSAERSGKLNFDYSYAGLFTENSEWQYWKPFIYKDIKEKDLEEIAQQKNIKFERKLGQIRLDSIETDSVFYDLVLLNTYGENKKKGLEDLFSFLEKTLLSDKKKEEIALLFGVHIGYSKLRKSYQIYGKETAIKFTLESRLDYITIESLYQFVFNNDKTKEIRQLEYLSPLLPDYKDFNITTNLTTYRILDTTVIAKKKEAMSEGPSITYSDFFRPIAIDICSWNNSNPLFKPDLNVTQKYLEEKFGPSLSAFLKRSNEKIAEKIPEEIREASPNAEVFGQTLQAINQKSIVNTFIKDELDQLNFTELKDRAKKSKIKIPTKLHGSTKDMEEIKRILRNTPSIL